VPQPWANSYVWGRLSALGVSVAVLTCLVDQALKFWLLLDFDLANRGRFAVMPFLDLVLIWNTGISYGLFPHQGPIGEWALLAFKLAAVVLLWRGCSLVGLACACDVASHGWSPRAYYRRRDRQCD